MEKLPPEYTVTARSIDTEFGRAIYNEISDSNLIFLSRHGEIHSVAPHEVNYRANIAALAKLGVTRILATNAVGSLRLDLVPDSLILIDDFLDFTRNRPTTLFGSGTGVRHTDFSMPYCPQLRTHLISTAASLDLAFLPRGTYVCAEGPRFESPAEVRMYGQMGGDVVGMTGIPEAIFAREAGICYASVSIVTNFGAGLTDQTVNHVDVLERMSANVARVRSLFINALQTISAQRTCGCAESVSIQP